MNWALSRLGDVVDWLGSIDGITYWTAAAAIGTIGATVLALYHEVIRIRFKRPVLSVRRTDEARELSSDGRPWLYYRLEIGNQRGRDAATGVQITLMRLTDVSAASKDESHLVPFQWTHAPGLASVIVPSGSGRMVDVIRVSQDSIPLQVQLCVVVSPNLEWNHLKLEHAYEIEVEISALNTDALRQVIRFNAFEEGPRFSLLSNKAPA